MEEGWHEGKVGCGLELGPGKAGEVETRPMGYGAADGEGEDVQRMMGGMPIIGGRWEGKAVGMGEGASWIDGWVWMKEGAHMVAHGWAWGWEA